VKVPVVKIVNPTDLTTQINIAYPMLVYRGNPAAELISPGN